MLNNQVLKGIPWSEYFFPIKGGTHSSGNTAHNQRVLALSFFAFWTSVSIWSSYITKAYIFAPLLSSKAKLKRRNITLYDISSTPLLSAQKHNVEKFSFIFEIHLLFIIKFYVVVCLFSLSPISTMSMSLGGKWMVNRQ